MNTYEVTDAGEVDRAGIPNLLEVFDGLTFPVSKAEMVDYAQDQGASEELLDMIQGMPEQDYRSIHEISIFAGAIDALPGSENMWASAESDDLPDVDATPKTGSLNRL